MALPWHAKQNTAPSSAYKSKDFSSQFKTITSFVNEQPRHS